ncbi:DUF1501 domain-containing protein [Schlesneria paludicola]|uniref:DUF1501 domain-containing protein n=1 Tax=Schlesneria paludicola TaxID=360056 RepID=UPI00029A882B|nr:DUF1501 domain-containing protein [Schlesneria paludicola]
MTFPQVSFDRRQFLQVSAAGVIGSSLPLSGRAIANPTSGTGRAKSVLIVLLSGGPAQLDTLDMKPNAPAEIRGEFSSIDTVTPGVSVCEHLPRLAQQMDRWSVVRTMSHTEHNHLLATHVALTGRPTPIPRGGSDLDRVESRNDFPNFAAALDVLRPRSDGIPSGVSLPNYLIEGPLTWPGQHAGFLGPKHDPWQINHDPNDPNFRIDSLSLQPGVTSSRLVSRRQLLEDLNSNRLAPAAKGRTSAFGEQQDLAFSLLTSDRVARAFEVNSEAAEVRDRYGRNKFGQSLMLARRLVEAGVPIIQATMGIVQTWDTHVDNWGRMKNTLLPQLDQGLAALMDDLSATGLLDQTLVVVMGEFGRTPKISTLPGEAVAGRDHWAATYSGLFAGAGVRGGQAVGQTDAIAAYPLSQPWSPADVCTTIFDALGVSHDALLVDPLGRPNHLLNGQVIAPLYAGV